MILRTSFVTGTEYVHHLSLVRGWDGDSKMSEEMLNNLAPVADVPFWMVEVSLPELFSANRRKVGEILIRADRKPVSARDGSSFLLARLPGCLVFLKRGDIPESSEGEEAAASFLYVPDDIEDHVELLGSEDES